ncbi:amidase [Shimia biformata]|uniref:amidase n=1 Tax=Shimia biformata TaxID=1294299 RepID=UPI0019518171|nr:amidase [Shimia biformata]
MAHLLDRDAGAILTDLETGTLSAEALMVATLERIGEANPHVNAIVSLQDEATLIEAARAADRGPRGGLLHGLPMAVKDLEDVAGLPVSMGSPLFAGTVSAKDGLIAERLRAAGAIFIGKTNTPEFGLGSHSFNPVHGVTRNPYDLTRSAGGSSGGAAAALATGMVALADGSDMMGSLRNPAAFCNVYGFRPSWGVVPRDTDSETFLQQLSTCGPMARSPADMALLMQVIGGPNPLVPHNAPAIDWRLPEVPMKGLRIGWLGDWGGVLPVEGGILDQCRTGLDVFAGAGARVDDLDAPFSAAAIWDSWITLRSWAVAGELGEAMADPTRRDKLKPEAQWEAERGLGFTATDIHKAGAIRSQWFTAAARLFDSYDALVLPSAQVWPFPAEWHWPKEINGTTMDTYHRWMEVVVPASLLGLPVVNLPCGFGANGLPMGMQLIGRKGDDRRLMAMAQSYHEATLWPQQTPPHIRKA